MPHNLNFNEDTDKQRVFDVIPRNTVCVLQMVIKPGGAGEDGWLTAAQSGGSHHLNCEYIVVEPGEYAKRKVFTRLTLSGDTDGHKEAARISRNTLRAILESAHGMRPDDKSEAAQAKRNVASYADFNDLRFVARLGVKPPENGYDAKNVISEVITPDHHDWKKVEQLPGAGSLGVASAPPNSITRPKWGE